MSRLRAESADIAAEKKFLPLRKAPGAALDFLDTAMSAALIYEMDVCRYDS